MRGRKEALGEDHPDVLTSMHSLSSTWRYLGRPVDGIYLLRDCLARQKETLGSDHPDTISSSETFLL